MLQVCMGGPRGSLSSLCHDGFPASVVTGCLSPSCLQGGLSLLHPKGHRPRMRAKCREVSTLHFVSAEQNDVEIVSWKG